MSFLSLSRLSNLDPVLLMEKVLPLCHRGEEVGDEQKYQDWVKVWESLKEKNSESLVTPVEISLKDNASFWVSPFVLMMMSWPNTELLKALNQIEKQIDFSGNPDFSNQIKITPQILQVHEKLKNEGIFLENNLNSAIYNWIERRRHQKNILQALLNAKAIQNKEDLSQHWFVQSLSFWELLELRGFKSELAVRYFENAHDRRMKHGS